MRRAFRITLGALACVAAVVAATLALPVPSWRSGELPAPPLHFAALADEAPLPRRIWIDTDAACGAGRRVDPDDCLAIAALLADPRVRIVGISTVFGNAPRPVVDRTVAALLAEQAPGARPPRHVGAAAPLNKALPNKAIAPCDDASLALAHALQSGPLTVVALGPLTNVVTALRQHPELRDRLQSLIAVMGRRPGHLFHPAEGVDAHSWLGHGPMFRDFNVAQDPAAVAAALAMQLPITLLPYDAARGMSVGADDLRRLHALGGPMAFAAQRSQAWLRYWQRDIGRDGFFAFDLMAAAFIAMPDGFACAPVRAWFGNDPKQYFPWLMPRMLLVAPDQRPAGDADPAAAARYCLPAAQAFKRRLLATLQTDAQRSVTLAR